MSRVSVYIDGFNLYFGLRRKGWRKYYWLDVVSLSQKLLKSEEELVEVKYFTSRISAPPDQVKRQSTYLDALNTLSNIHIYYGHYQNNNSICRNCGNVTYQPNEKMTDVNIAVELLSDAFNDLYDKAIIISADSDLVPPIMKIKEIFPSRKIVVAIPPGNSSKILCDIASHFIIGQAQIRQSLLPHSIQTKSGFTITKPLQWA